MDTEVGGEQTQYVLFSHRNINSPVTNNVITRYESIQTVTKPHARESGQLGGMSFILSFPFSTLFLYWRSPKGSSENTPAPSSTSNTVSKERGEQKAENMRYGQAISEQGVGGFTSPELNNGSATQEGGSAEQEMDADKTRSAQGYGGDSDMGKEVGG